MRVTSFLIATLCLALLLVLDGFYVAKLKYDFNQGTLNESVVRDGRLGKLLRKNGLISVTPESHQRAVRGLCVSDDYLRQGESEKRARFEFKLASLYPQKVTLSVSWHDDGKKHTLKKVLMVEPNKYYYQSELKPPKHKALEIVLHSAPNKYSEFFVSDIRIAGQGGVNLILYKDAKATDLIAPISNLKNKSVKNKAFGFIGEKIAIGASFSMNLKKPLRELGFYDHARLPGLKSKGICEYKVASQIGLENKQVQKGELAVIDIELAEDFLTGKKNGIFSNLRSKGRISEVPASITIMTDGVSSRQNVGLRFHGGVFRREPNLLNGYRIYARNSYGKGTLGSETGFFENSDVPVRTIVLRNHQGYGHKPEDYGDGRRGFNPYNQSLATDIAHSIGAIAPRTRLVELRINGVTQDLYIALEHLSERSISLALGHEDLTLFVHKKINSSEASNLFRAMRNKILRESKGEQTFELFKQYYSVDNVINSILLTAYIGDDDFCQGVEVFDEVKQADAVSRVTSINWDLDHAFMSFDMEQWRSKIDPSRYGFLILSPRHGAGCIRTQIYSYVYAQSKQFRTLVRDRLEYLLKNNLSVDALDGLLEKYSKIDDAYYDKKYEHILVDLKDYFRRRPAVLLHQLSSLESASGS